MAMAKLRKRAAAKRDLVQHYVYLAENAGVPTAESFLRQADQTFSNLAQFPRMGAELALRGTKISGMRKWQVKEIEKFLIFYLARRDGLSIVRVPHAAQDWWALLGLV